MHACAKFGALTRGPVGVNVILEIQPPEAIEAILAEGIDVLATGFGDPELWVDRAHAAGAKIFHRCETPAEARAAARAGADVVIAQGSDSGGHTGIVPTFALVPQVVDAAEGTPVLAAGGIADGRGLVAALALGAEGVLLGTRLVASEESGAHPVYKSGIVAAQAADSIVTDIFEIGWPGRPERVLRNATTDAWGREPEPRSRPSARPVEIIARRRLPDGGARASRAGSSTPRMQVTKELSARWRSTPARAPGLYGRSFLPAKSSAGSARKPRRRSRHSRRGC